MVQKTRQWQLAHKPRDHPKLDGPEQTFKLVEGVELPELQDGDLLVKTTYLSNDPAQRGWIDPDIPEERLYVPPVKLGSPMQARGLAEVIESKSQKFQKGDVVIASTGWSEYAVVKEAQTQPAPDLPKGQSKTAYLGALGLTGLTAYFGLTGVGNTTKDDVVVISGAAGATGSMAVQIAKKILGAKKVIGIAGTDEKCRWVEKIGADLCLNYKKDSFADDLRAATPGPDGFADVYFDNVGGEILDLMLTRLGHGGRVIACGAISAYNTAQERTTGLKNWFDVVIMRLNIKGFIVLDFMKDFPKAIEIFNKALEDGKLDLEGGETVVKGSFEDVPATWTKLFAGGNQGKLITQIE
ncbi:Putative GroES-like superfamily, alcohol dehydrogenase-like, NAD(P)-binding domain superfamily [Septoria linicola]|uniref:GroES-like superfamily, alcohol dehydrogenase-like, NAD(P)-binding domain superfamily n=1 Tax=Septoria linicola TaxID=215465 RepID=A0A9Q9EFL9_9PEZI|nr:putative GroES-like superfamily, alcohol dehydrogenase-like, NAD(P)-binding domain superfamily [Septoria linicola]USW48044.1 Putative GroES-like superfamily, alcohol dehydrogenase-like, NAD(P)-binding domain superfamily [Septoria linicola]